VGAVRRETDRVGSDIVVEMEARVKARVKQRAELNVDLRTPGMMIAGGQQLARRRGEGYSAVDNDRKMHR
jgi:hypothetical protein